MTTIILTRHGHVDWIAPTRFRGHAELALSPLGERQAQALAQRIASGAKPDVIYTSPLLRCVHTGDAIARASGVQAQQLADLIDTDYGQWQGLNYQEVGARWPEELRLWLSAPDMACIPEGETLAAVLVRVSAVLHLILQQHNEQTVLLVGHDSINRILLLHCLGLPLSHYRRIKQDPCGLNEIALEGETFTIHRINDTYHLKDVR